MSERDSDAIDRREKGFLEEIRRLARPSMPRSVQNFLWAAGIAGLFLPVSILVLVQDLRLKEALIYLAGRGAGSHPCRAVCFCGPTADYGSQNYGSYNNNRRPAAGAGAGGNFKPRQVKIPCNDEP